MKQLLQITSIPVAFELKIQNARLEYPPSTAEVEISRAEGGGLRMRSQPIKLNIDTFAARDSVSPSTSTCIKQAAERGKNAAYEATAQYASEGQLMVKAKMDEDVLSQIIAQRSAKPGGEFQLGFIPTARPEINWSEPDLVIEYQLDKLNFDLKAANGNFEFIPGDIELVITQQPGLKVKYIGQPIYVPPSYAEKVSAVNIKA